MGNIYRDEIICFNEYKIDGNEDIFEFILNERKDEIDKNRFFLRYLPEQQFLKYDFTNEESLWKFRDVCGTIDNPIMKMGGCNLRASEMDKGLRYGGIKMSDPEGKIMGSFDIRYGVMTYSPIFPPFYKERDLIKFVNDIYFTTMKFEEVMLQQINHVSEFYVHVGEYETAKEMVKYGRYKLEKVSKDQMIDFINIPEEGEKIYKKNLY